jgi:glucose/arabinose dehydrogenase
MKTLLLGWLLMACLPACARELPLDTIRLPAGFRISLYADKVPGARSMALAPDGTLFVGTRGDTVYALPNRTGGPQADAVLTLIKGLDTPNGVAFRDGALYVAEIGRILRYDHITARLNDPPKPVVVSDAFPRDTHHGWKFIRFGPDGRLYVPVGAPCNVCEPDAARYAALFRLNADGSGLEQYARGIRNTVGFDWHPQSGELWFTDNGRDWLGNHAPPDELNRAPHAGLHFGFPYCHGRAIADPEYGSKHACAEFTPPARELDAHVAALGMRFYTGTMFPATWRGRIFIAEHGSWNRIPPLGYRLTTARIEDGRVVAYEVFAEGWLKGIAAWGRPVDVQVMPDGALLLSDDKAGLIYRISHGKQQGQTQPALPSTRGRSRTGA